MKPDWGGSDWVPRKQSTLRGWSDTETGLPGQNSWHRAYWSSRNVWTLLSDIWSYLWVILCGVRVGLYDATVWSISPMRSG